jgi:hypothetical protein
MINNPQRQPHMAHLWSQRLTLVFFHPKFSSAIGLENALVRADRGQLNRAGHGWGAVVGGGEGKVQYRKGSMGEIGYIILSSGNIILRKSATSILPKNCKRAEHSAVISIASLSRVSFNDNAVRNGVILS